MMLMDKKFEAMILCKLGQLCCVNNGTVRAKKR